MNNLEAVEVLKNTGPMVGLVIARVKDRDKAASSIAIDEDLIYSVLTPKEHDNLYCEYPLLVC